MNYLIQSICVSSIFITASAAPSKDREIEEFIDRLLDSDKFEKLADRIAERAADRIITLQQLNTHVDDKKINVRKTDKSKNENKALDNDKKATNDIDNNTTELKKSDNDKFEVRGSNNKKPEATVFKYPNLPKRSQQSRDITKQTDDSEQENAEASKPESIEIIESSEDNKSKEKTRSAERESKIDIEDENEKYDDDEHSGKEEKETKHKNEKPKINYSVALRNLANFSGEDLSLNFKHFTTRVQYTTVHKKQNKDFSGEKEDLISYKKRARNEKDNTVSNRVYVTPKTTTKKVTSNKEKTVGKMSKPKEEDSDLSIESKNFKESKEIEEVKGKNIEKDKEKILMKNETENSKSAFDENSSSSRSHSEESISGSGSHERTFTKSKDHTSHKSHETTTAAHKDEKEHDTNKAFTFNLRAKESNEVSKSKSTENTTRSVRAKETTPKITDANASGSGTESDDNRVSIADSEKVDAKSKSENINLRDKVREANGKLFAFAQSPDYEEYHEKLSQILKSVKDKKDSSKKDFISQDLLDFVESS